MPYKELEELQPLQDEIDACLQGHKPLLTGYAHQQPDGTCFMDLMAEINGQPVPFVFKEGLTLQETFNLMSDLSQLAWVIQAMVI